MDILYYYPIVDMQVLAAICVCLTAISYGANVAITSAVIFAFQKDADDQMKMTLEEASWLRKRKVFLCPTTERCYLQSRNYSETTFQDEIKHS